MHILINNNFLIFDNYKIKCAVGKRGIGFKKREGDLLTPKGTFYPKLILYRKDRIRNLKTNIKKIAINKKMGWCDDPKSIKYNQIISLPADCSFEELYRKDNIYDLIVVLNYNMSPTIRNKGSAIFIHVAGKAYEKTMGCIAVSEKNLRKILLNLSQNTKIIIF